MRTIFADVGRGRRFTGNLKIRCSTIQNKNNDGYRYR